MTDSSDATYRRSRQFIECQGRQATHTVDRFSTFEARLGTSCFTREGDELSCVNPASPSCRNAARTVIQQRGRSQCTCALIRFRKLVQTCTTKVPVKRAGLVRNSNLWFAATLSNDDSGPAPKVAFGERQCRALRTIA